MSIRLSAAIATYESHWSAHWAESQIETVRAGVAAGETDGANYVTMIPSPPANRVRELCLSTFVNKDSISDTHMYISLYDGSNHYDIRNRQMVGNLQETTWGIGSIIVSEGWSVEIRLGAAAATNESHWSAHWVERDA